MDGVGYRCVVDVRCEWATDGLYTRIVHEGCRFMDDVRCRCMDDVRCRWMDDVGRRWRGEMPCRRRDDLRSSWAGGLRGTCMDEEGRPSMDGTSGMAMGGLGTMSM